MGMLIRRHTDRTQPTEAASKKEAAEVKAEQPKKSAKSKTKGEG